MKNKLFIIEKYNYGEILPNSWISTKWIIYSNLFIDIIKEYNRDDSIENSNRTINEEELNIIKNDINKIKNDSTIVNAYDGVAWSFEEYKDNSLIWNKEIGYIYGIKELEEITYILEK